MKRKLRKKGLSTDVDGLNVKEEEADFKPDITKSITAPIHRRWSTGDGLKEHPPPPTSTQRSMRADSEPGLTREDRSELSVERHATTSFLNHYGRPPQFEGHPQSLLQLAASMFVDAKGDSPLQLATEAVAISFLANWPGRQHLSDLAARLYGQALFAAQKAMQTPDQATTDATLLSILLFALYESINLSSHSDVARAKHIYGAVAIVKARGETMFQSTRSTLLFRIVHKQMLLSKVQRNPGADDQLTSRHAVDNLAHGQDAPFAWVKSPSLLPELFPTVKSLLTDDAMPLDIAAVGSLVHNVSDVQEELCGWEPNAHDWQVLRSVDIGWTSSTLYSCFETSTETESAFYGSQRPNIQC